MAANATGGVVTGAILGTWALWFTVGQQIRGHDERIDDLREDNRRWFRDRDAALHRELHRLDQQRVHAGVTSAGIAAMAEEEVKRIALHEYRDEISAKRRRYRELATAEAGWTHGKLRKRRSRTLSRFGLTDDQRTVLALWRSIPTPDGGPHRSISDDPTDPGLEADLRRFEREGDPAPEA